MPRLSLYRPEKGNDYKFFDQRMSEMFTVGGVDVNIHKYLGPVTQGNVSMTEPGGATTLLGIQDLLFLDYCLNKKHYYLYQEYNPQCLEMEQEFHIH